MNSMNKILSTVILLGFILLCGCNTQPSPIRSVRINAILPAVPW